MPNAKNDLLVALKQYFDETDPLTSAFQRAAHSIKAIIFNEYISAGDEVPSTVQISKRLDINVMTASKSLQTLRGENIIKRRRGNPYVVAEGAKDIIIEIVNDELKSGAVKFLKFTMQHFDISKTQMDEWMK